MTTRFQIIGGGVAGLTAAIALAQHGVLSTIHEASEAFTTVGAGLQLSPNATRILQELNVDLSAGHSAARIALHQASGRQIATMPLTTTDAPYLHIHRADLIAALFARAKELGVGFSMGQAVEACDLTGSVIAASGVHTRDQARYSGYAAYRATIERPPNFPSETKVYMGRDRHVVLYPLAARKLLNIVAVTKSPTWTEIGWSQPGNTAELIRAFKNYDSALLDMLSRVDNTQKWALLHSLTPQFSDPDQTIYIGDAAMSSVPFMAQGAAMAVEDAYILARLVQKYAPDDLAARMHHLRAERRKAVAKAAWSNAALFHHQLPMPAAMQDMGMSFASKLAPKRIQRRYDWIYDFDAMRLDI